MTTSWIVRAMRVSYADAADAILHRAELLGLLPEDWQAADIAKTKWRQILHDVSKEML